MTIARPETTTDRDILHRHHRFVLSADEIASRASTWEQRMAVKYYQKLFKEYALCDLSRYKASLSISSLFIVSDARPLNCKENKVGLRWRTEKEVVDGKGQFICGHLACSKSEDLHSYEVNFAYVEEDMRKNELVKVNKSNNFFSVIYIKNR